MGVQKAETLILWKELDQCRNVQGRQREILYQYLIGRKIKTLYEVDPEILLDYWRFIQNSHLMPGQKQVYGSVLEQCIREICHPRFAHVCQEIEDTGIPRDPMRKKTEAFLMASGICRLEEIDYPLRHQYEQYLHAIRCGHKMEALKMLDRLKLYDIHKRYHPLRPLLFRQKILFLLYLPNYEMAKEFYYVRNKEELVFDFSLQASLLLKKQIFQMLEHVLSLPCRRKNRRELYLVPLRRLYLYCVEQKISDLERMELTEIQGFKQSMEGCVGTKLSVYMQIVDSTRKFLFLNASTIHWYANVWYLERFRLAEGRSNPANPVRTFRFHRIQNRFHRKLFQEYMQYCLGISRYSIQTIRCSYYSIYEFLQFWDLYRGDIRNLTQSEIEFFIRMLENVEIKEETFNRKLFHIYAFLRWMMAKEYRKELPGYPEYYNKKVIPVHHDRMVPSKIEEEVLRNLQYFPYHLRLMYLNLATVGLRIHEVCCLKADAYFLRGKDAWIRVRQYKMWNEKIVPIPMALYEIMRAYIKKNQLQPNAYIFSARNGGPYRTGTFRKQMKEICRKCGIFYPFQTHDYRHTVATIFYQNGVSIQAVRDYLGHKTEDMTKQYLDIIPMQMEKKNEAYFKGRKEKHEGKNL